MARLAVIAVDRDTTETLGHLLMPHEILGLGTPSLAVDFVRENRPDLVLITLELKDTDSVDLISRLCECPETPPVIALTQSADVRLAVSAIQAGAFDLLVRPLRRHDVTDSVMRALAAGVRNPDRPDDEAMSRLIGVSPAMERLRSTIRRVAPSRAPVLVVGESGVGKELVAEAIHRLSYRRDRPFQARNCGALPEQLFESEMFGTERGAYTGAVSREGAFELANGGTLFLDEVAELVPANQVKLLRALESGRFHRVGGVSERRVDVRIVSATNRDLKVLLAGGSFRQDLYYRLNVLQIAIPPLRQRREDIPLLVRHFAQRGVESAADDPDGPRAAGFSRDALARLSDYDWPGNIRELRNVVERTVVCAERTPVRSADIRFG